MESEMISTYLEDVRPLIRSPEVNVTPRRADHIQVFIPLTDVALTYAG